MAHVYPEGCVFNSLDDIYEQLIYSAQNYQRMPNVIKYDQRREKIKKILMNYLLVFQK